MKKVAGIAAIVLILALAGVALAQDTQVVDILLSKLIKNYAMSTNWGNIYFNKADLHKLIHFAANLRPSVIGTFETDTGVTLKVKALGFDKGVVTLSLERI